MQYTIIPRSQATYRLGMKAMTVWLGMLGAVAPGTAGRVAFRIWSTPRRFALPRRERP